MSPGHVTPATAARASGMSFRATFLSYVKPGHDELVSIARG
jgi:hypothetical protein